MTSKAYYAAHREHLLADCAARYRRLKAQRAAAQCVDCNTTLKMDYRTKRCSPCRKAWRAAYQKAYYAAHTDEVKARSAAWAKAHPGAYVHNRRRTSLRMYGLTPEAYRDMLVGQAGRCLICGFVSAGQLQVDHDHATGAVRGLLCGPCNRVLGLARDNARTLRSAAHYLGMAA